MSKENVVIIQADTDPAKKSIKDLRKELKDLKDEMANLEEGSDAFLEVANKAGEVKHQIDEINESIKGASADFGDMVGNVTNVAAGITGAFQAVAGGLQAMGVESKALDETIARMQGLMAVTQGLGSIDTAIKSLDKLRNSITATTGAAKLLKAALQPKVFLAIGAAITALTFIFNRHKEKQEELIAAQEEYNKKIEEEKRIKRESQVKQYLDDLDAELRIKQEIAGIKYGDDELTKQKELLKLYNGELIRYKVEKEFYENGHRVIGEDPVAALKERTEAYNKYAELVKKTTQEIMVLEATAPFRAEQERKRQEEEAAKTAADLARANQEKLKSYKDEEATIQYLIKLYEELDAANPVELAKEKLNLENRRLSNIKSYYGETSEQYKEQLIIVRGLEEEYAKLTEVKEETLTQEQIQLALENDKLKEMAKGWVYNEETAIETFNRISEELKLALDRDLISQQDYDTAVKNLAKERSRYIAQQTVQTFSAASGLITTILDGIADNQDKNNKEGFETSKKLQIASATIQMLSGIATALSGAFTTKSGPWDIALAVIQAGTIAASGAAQIAKIKSTKFDGGGSGANVSSSSVASTIMPPVQYSQAVQGASTEGAIKDTKVYVTETDITSTINKVSVQENENRY